MRDKAVVKEKIDSLLSDIQVKNSEILDELIFNSIIQIDKIADTLCKSRVRQNKSMVKRLIYLINNNIYENSDFCKNPLDIYKDSQKLHIYFNTYLKDEGYAVSTINCYNSDYWFLLSEVIGRYGTNQWCLLDFTYPDEYSAFERFKHCLGRYYLILGKQHIDWTRKMKLSHMANQINAQSGVNDFYSNLIIEYIMEGKKVTEIQFFDFKDGVEVQKKDYRCFKPYKSVSVVERLSYAPVGYLTGVLKPQLKPTNELKGSRKQRSTFDISLIPDEFREELYLYARYKSDLIIDKKRLSTWTIRTDSRKNYIKGILEGKTLSDLKHLRSGTFCASLSMFASTLIEISDFVIKNDILKPEELTVFNLSNADIFQRYIQTLIDNKVLITTSHFSRLTILTPLWNINYCFFAEYSDLFGKRYNLTKDEINILAKEQSEKFLKLKVAVDSVVVISPHSSKVTKKAILDLDSPKLYIVKAIKAIYEELDSNINAKKFTSRSAIKMRNLCIISCLLYMPLRSRNWRDMKIGYHQYNECIYKNKDGLYEIYIPKSCFKNFRQENIPDPFIFVYPKDMSEIIEAYILYARPELDRIESEFLFLTYRSEKLDADSLNKAVGFTLERYGDHSIYKGRVNVHFFRDIVATSFLKENKGSYSLAALILLDSEEMIKKHYGHLQPSDANKIWSSSLSLGLGALA